ncbi:MAG TPA: group I intron-associated PD-(D/E)XK endonuclease [Pyrinomonadaceae bacterium]|nr:group I intron-associated PD-(D/E)XK endonuclease [Pyrinomonadaceae bacterium]
MLSEQQRKAETARVKVEARALELGIVYSRPSVEGLRYDCILDIEGKLYRSQIKYCDCKSVTAAGALQLRLRSQAGQGAARCYTADEVDALLVYLPCVDRICFFPQEVFCGKSGLNIRLEPTRNGQSKGCVPAEEFYW